MKFFIYFILDIHVDNKYETYFKETLRFYTKHGLSWELFVDIIQLINRHPDSKYKFADTQYAILKQLSPKEFPITEYNECLTCNSVNECEPKRDICEQCGKVLNKTNVIMFISLKHQLRNELNKNKIYLRLEDNSNQETTVLSDILDGAMSKDLGHHQLSFTLNTDGVQVYNQVCGQSILYRTISQQK